MVVLTGIRVMPLMNLHLNDEQRMLRDSVARLFATESSPERVRAAEPSGFDPELWQQLLLAGITTMRVAEAAGGLGSPLIDALLVAEEAGRHLASAPVAEAIVAARLLAQLADDNDDLLARVLEGAVVTLALQEVCDDTPQVVPGGTAAEAVLALEGDAVWIIDGDDDAVPAASLGSAALGNMVLSAKSSRRLLARGDAAKQAFAAAVEEWKLLTAAMLAGLARRGLEIAADYSKERHAFGRPIGGFQGIAHPLADSVTEVEGAQLLNWRAVWAIAHQHEDAAATISMAFWWASQSAARAMARALHTFGGYGVSLEYDIQLYYRRAKAWALTAGDPRQELLRVAERLWNSAAHATTLPDAGGCELDFSLGSEAQAFGEQIKQYFDQHLTPELREHAQHSTEGYHPDFSRQLARDGLLFPHWPAAYGGQERNPYDMAAMTAVLESFGWEHVTAPITNQVAQALMYFASDEVKAEALTRFQSGDALACMGFTEPSCGCDLFAAKTRATLREDGNWLVNGEKIFTSAAHLADYCFLLARTDPEQAKHAGLSVFLVPMNLPGVDIQALHMLHEERTNIVFFSDVVLPAKYLVGEVNGGLQVMAKTLEMEHAAGDEYRQGHVSTLQAVETWALQARRHGAPLLQDPDAAGRLAQARVHLAVSTVLCMRALWSMVEKIPNRYWGPMAKLFATEIYHRDATDLMDLAAPESLFHGKHGLGRLELGYRQSIGCTIYGGTSEIQRSLVAEQALGMPKSRS
jgi:alkylation response protein AidB-like acyl-CoA dehydrogenase